MTADEQYIKLALQFAFDQATDPSTQNGAILVHPNSGLVLSGSANFFPAKVHYKPERWERPLKYSFVEHAERNAIYSAAKGGITTWGLTMYCPWFACADCARAIVQAGIAEVVGLSSMENTNERWNASVEVGNTILDEGGVKRRYIKPEIPFGIKLRRDGQLVEF